MPSLLPVSRLYLTFGCECQCYSTSLSYCFWHSTDSTVVYVGSCDTCTVATMHTALQVTDCLLSKGFT